MTSSPTPAVLPDARALIADVFRSWDMRRQADAYEAGSYDETLPMQALVARLSPPASDAAVPAGARWTIEGVMAEMLAVAVASIEAEEGDEILEDWPIDCRADVDRWQSVISRALAAAPKVASDTDEHGDIVTIAYMMGAKDERDRHAKATTPGGDLLEQAAVVELVQIMEAATAEPGRLVWDHTPEEVGLHVMENRGAFLRALKPAGDGGEA
jgi:hypothetical protein